MGMLALIYVQFWPSLISYFGYKHLFVKYFIFSMAVNGYSLVKIYHIWVSMVKIYHSLPLRPLGVERKDTPPYVGRVGRVGGTESVRLGPTVKIDFCFPVPLPKSI